MSDFRVLFLYPNQRAESLVPPAVALFSSLLKQRDFEVDLFDTSLYELDADDYTDAKPSGDGERGDEKAVVKNLLVRPYESRIDAYLKHESAVDGFTKKLEEFQPDLIAVTATESTVLLAVNLLGAANKRRVPTLLGGVFATFAPQHAISFPEIDMICVGEGEHAIVDLCEKMRSGLSIMDVSNLWIKQSDGNVRKNPVGSIVDVNNQPMLDIELFDEARWYRPMYGKTYRMLPMETHRGCPYTCSYCNSPAQNMLYKEKTNQLFFRKRSIDDIARELAYFRDEFKLEYVYFWADTFFAYSNKEFDEFCEMYSDFKLPFWCQTRPETVTEERINKLKNVGLHMIAFGLEHGNEQFRRDVIIRNYTNEAAVKSFSIIKDSAVPFTVNNIIGFPGETRELATDTIELNRQIKPDQMSCSILQPYYGTPLRSTAVRNGYLKADTICPANSDDTLMDMPDFQPNAIKGLRRTFAMYVHFPKERWSEIKRAEQLDAEGDRVWNSLREEFVSTFYETPEIDITEQGNFTAQGGLAASNQ